MHPFFIGISKCKPVSYWIHVATAAPLPENTAYSKQQSSTESLLYLQINNKI